MAFGCHVETQSPRRVRKDCEGTAQPFDGDLAVWPKLWAAHTSGHLLNAEVYRVSEFLHLGRNTQVAVTSTAMTKRGRSPNVSRAESMRGMAPPRCPQSPAPLRPPHTRCRRARGQQLARSRPVKHCLWPAPMRGGDEQRTPFRPAEHASAAAAVERECLQ